MFRYSMTVRGVNPQALMLPNACLHHYQAAPSEAELAREANRAQRPASFWRRWLHRDTRG